MLKSKLYNFLIAPKYRVWRHILLISVFVLLSFRRIFYVYRDDEAALGGWLYILCFITLAVYLFSVYMNLYVLVPRLLLKKRYALYLTGLFIVVLIPLTYQIGQEYVVRTLFDLPHRAVAYFSPIIVLANLSNFMILLVSILGTSIPQIFKVRIEENQRISRMEQQHIKSELDQLKEQLSPDFLSNILNKTSVLVKTDPQKASDMLMRLGQLLRYQLYDCNRERVLLSAEVNFIKGYLELEKMYNSRFEYELAVDGKLKDIFIPPMLFIPFVQHAIQRIENTNESISLHVCLTPERNALLFICRTSNKVLISEVELYAIKKRLDLIYPDEGYLLSIVHNEARLQLKDIVEL